MMIHWYSTVKGDDLLAKIEVGRTYRVEKKMVGAGAKRKEKDVRILDPSHEQAWMAIKAAYAGV